MTNQTANTLIEKSPIVNDANRAYSAAVVPLNNPEWRALVGEEFCNYFENEPEGETEKYAWDTRRVDQLVNLKIWKR